MNKTKPDNNWPISLLKQEAQHLREKTKGILEGVVTTTEGGGDSLIHSFFIKAPLLDGYRYRLVSVSHSILAPFPAHIWYDATSGYSADQVGNTPWSLIDKNSDFENEQQLRNRLTEIFSSLITQQIIESLVAQSKPVHV